MSSSKKQILTYNQKALFAVIDAIAAKSLSRLLCKLNNIEYIKEGKKKTKQSKRTIVSISNCFIDLIKSRRFLLYLHHTGESSTPLLTRSIAFIL